MRSWLAALLLIACGGAKDPSDSASPSSGTATSTDTPTGTGPGTGRPTGTGTGEGSGTGVPTGAGTGVLTGTGTGVPTGTGTGVPTGTGTGAATGTGTGAATGTGTGWVTPSDTSVPPLAFTVDPTFVQNPNPMAPLVWIATATTDRPTRATLTLSDGVDVRTLTFDGYRTRHELDILGLRAGREVTVVLAVESATGERLEAPPHAIQVDPFDVSDQMTVVHSDPARMEPGLTLLRYENNLVMLDAEGIVRWRYGPLVMPRFTALALNRNEAGEILVLLGHRSQYDATEARLIDPRGNTLAAYVPPSAAGPGHTPVDVVAFHHDVQPGPDDGYVAVTIEGRFVTDYPASEDSPVPREDITLAADVIVEFARDGTVRRRYPLFDLLDPRRIGYDAVEKTSIWDRLLGTETRDWSHSNSVFYDAATDGYLVSVRHQDAIVHLDRASGQISWILGPHENWGPSHQDLLLTPTTPDFTWQYHEHAVSLSSDGTVLMFDNGNWRASPWDPRTPPEETVSRALEVRVDPVAKTVEHVWSYDRGVFSATQGDLRRLPTTGNMMVLFGNIIEPDDGVDVRVIEVTHTDTPEVIWELAVDSDEALFRTVRVPSLYPAGVLVP